MRVRTRMSSVTSLPGTETDSSSHAGQPSRSSSKICTDPIEAEADALTLQFEGTSTTTSPMEDWIRTRCSPGEISAVVRSTRTSPTEWRSSKAPSRRHGFLPMWTSPTRLMYLCTTGGSRCQPHQSGPSERARSPVSHAPSQPLFLPPPRPLGPPSSSSSDLPKMSPRPMATRITGQLRPIASRPSQTV